MKLFFLHLFTLRRSAPVDQGQQTFSIRSLILILRLCILNYICKAMKLVQILRNSNLTPYDMSEVTKRLKLQRHETSRWTRPWVSTIISFSCMNQLYYFEGILCWVDRCEQRALLITHRKNGWKNQRPPVTKTPNVGKEKDVLLSKKCLQFKFKPLCNSVIAHVSRKRIKVGLRHIT